MSGIARVAVVAGLTWMAPTFADPGVEAQGVTRTIHVTVSRADGTPVLDMRPDEFDVREGGRPQEVTAGPATRPLRVALIVSDRGGGQFQQGALVFSEAILGSGEVGITGIVVQPERLTDFTSEPDRLRGAILRLGRRSTAPDAGAQLIEAIMDAAKTVRRDGTRSAIVVMRLGGEDTTPMAANTVLNAIRASGAVMYVVSPAGVDRAMTRSDRFGESVTVVPTVLGVGVGDSGGRSIDVAANTMRPVMQQVALELLNQYEITYTLPQGMKPANRLSVSSRRKGVTVHAPTRLGP
jgi:hypothetical protein